MVDFLFQFLGENLGMILAPIFLFMFGAMIWQNATKKWHNNVKPSVTLERIELNRYQLKEETNWEEILFPGLIGLVFLGLFALTLPGILSGDVPLPLLVGLFLAFLLGLGMGIKFCKRLLVLVRMRPGKLLLSEWPLKLGNQVTVTFQRDFFGELNIRDITPRLVSKCEVLAQHENRTKSETYTVNVYQDEINIFSLGGSRGRYEQEFTVSLPQFGLPSFERPDHKYRWFLEVDLEIESLPDTTSKFELFVIPEITERD